MKISEIEAFDVYGDGTLILKTNLSEPVEGAQYAWYLIEGEETLVKVWFQNNRYTAIKLEKTGRYTIRAYVLDKDKHKTKKEIPFVANKKTSPILAEKTGDVKPEITVTPVVKKLSDSFWRFSVEEELPAGTQLAWYIYKEGETVPLYKQMYAKTTNYVHRFKEGGNYVLKVFAVLNNEKYTGISDVFTVG